MATYHVSSTSELFEKSEPDSLARWIGVLAGVGLLVSAFFLPHSLVTQVNTGIVAVLIIATSLLGMYAPLARFPAILFAGWLLAFSFVLDHVSRTTLWHDVLMASIVIGASFVRDHLLARSRGTSQRPLPSM